MTDESQIKSNYNNKMSSNIRKIHILLSSVAHKTAKINTNKKQNTHNIKRKKNPTPTTKNKKHPQQPAT